MFICEIKLVGIQSNRTVLQADFLASFFSAFILGFCVDFKSFTLWPRLVLMINYLSVIQIFSTLVQILSYHWLRLILFYLSQVFVTDVILIGKHFPRKLKFPPITKQ